MRDIKQAVVTLNSMDEKHLKEHTAQLKSKKPTHSHRATHNHPNYRGEKHSLQGKTGKTHAIC